MIPAPVALAVDADVTLVPRGAHDAADMFALVDRHRAQLREWLGWVDLTRGLADMRRYAQYAEAQFESRLAFDYAIRERGVAAGGIGLHALDWSNRCAQMGYWLSPEAVGRGLVARAAVRLTTHAVVALGLHRVEIRCVTANVRSRAVAERLRYSFEGILAEAHVLHGAFRDLALYATTGPRWRELVAR